MGCDCLRVSVSILTREPALMASRELRKPELRGVEGEGGFDVINHIPDMHHFSVHLF